MIAVFCLLMGITPPLDIPAEKLGDEDLLMRAAYPFVLQSRKDWDAWEKPRLAQSAADYEELRRRGHSVPGLFLNQGTAYLLTEDRSRAVLAFRRGLRLDPKHAPLQTALTQAREQVAREATDSFGRPPDVFWPAWLPYLEPGFAWLLAEAGYVVACICFTSWLILRRSPILFVMGGSLVIVLVFGVQATVAEAALRLDEQRPVVVIAADQVALRQGNGRSYPAYPARLQRGAEARLLHQRKNWLQIELAGGEVGWVPSAAALVDEP